MSEQGIRIHLREWEKKPPDAEGGLRDLFLPQDPWIQEVVSRLNSAGMMEITEQRSGLCVEAFSFVGRIRLGNITITVQPKIEGLPLLRLLRYAYGLRDVHLYDDVGYGGASGTFVELLIHQLAAEVSELIARGLHRRYVSRFDYLPSPKGRIDIQRIAQQGGLLTAALPCRHHPRLENCLLNQVLLAGILIGTSLTEDTLLRTKLFRLAGILREGILEIRMERQVFEKLDQEKNRLTFAYEPSIAIIKLLVQNIGIQIEKDVDSFLFNGFLFDMNRFFQKLISRFLSDHLYGYTLHEEHRLKGMMAYVPEYNPLRRRPPEPRPDFAILKDDKIIAILDTKYRDLWATSLPREMLYQMSMYALSQGGSLGIATILFPTMEREAKEARIEIREPLKGNSKAYVVLRPIDMMELDNLLFKKTGIERERAASSYARWLTFGNISGN